MESENIHRLRKHYFYLIEHITLLTQLLKKAQLNDGLCFSLPHLSKDDLGENPEIIIVEKLTGQHAFNMAIKHLSQNELKDNMPGVFSPRLPGVITLTLNQDQKLEVHERINIINNLKTKFASLIKSLSPSTDVRFEIVSQALPNLIKKAATRKILVVPEDCKRVGFTWKRFYSVRKKTAQEWDQYLLNAIKQGKLKDPLWEKSIEMERQILRNNNDVNEFTSRRPIRISPAMNITLNGNGVKATTVVAHSPLWVFNQRPVVGSLKNFNSEDTKRQTPQRNETLLIPRLHLYKLNN